MKWGEPVSMSGREDWRRWLDANHTSASEVFVLVVKERSNLPGLRYDEAVQEALCFGWIDGIARRYDDDFSLNRFTPRRKGSNWSESNRARIKRLSEDGLIAPSGWAALPEDVSREIRKP